MLAIDPLAIVVCNLAGLFLGMVVFRNLIVVSLAWIWLLIPWFWWRTGGELASMIYVVVINVLFILAMVPEIKMALKYQK